MAEEGFLSRWSRRKRGDAAEEAAEALPPAAEAPVAAPPVAQLEPILDLADLPSIESLTIESPVTAFLRPGVPAGLRNAALRRAWSLDPVIRDFVGPADYAWDFNAPDGIPGFALELGEDASRLLRQAIGGLGQEEDAPVAAGMADVEPALAELTEEGGGAGTEDLLVAEAPTSAAEPDTDVPTARRRHGSALPS